MDPRQFAPHHSAHDALHARGGGTLRPGGDHPQGPHRGLRYPRGAAPAHGRGHILRADHRAAGRNCLGERGARRAAGGRARHRRQDGIAPAGGRRRRDCWRSESAGRSGAEDLLAAEDRAQPGICLRADRGPEAGGSRRRGPAVSEMARARGLRRVVRATLGRAYPRIIGANRERSWLFYDTVLPLLGTIAFVYVYKALGAPDRVVGYVIMGGATMAFWMNVMWNMAAEVFMEPVFLASGFYFPVRALGFWVGMGTSIIPLTLALDAMRQLLFPGSHPALLPVRAELGALVGLAVMFMLVARWSLRKMEYLARREGRLSLRF